MRKYNPLTNSHEDVLNRGILRVRLHVRFPKPDDEYRLLVFASRNVHNDLNYSPYWNLKQDEWGEFEFWLKHLPDLPESLHCWLFIKELNQDKTPIEELLCWGRCAPQDLVRQEGHQMALFDIEKQEQGVLSLYLKNCDESLRVSLQTPQTNYRRLQMQTESRLDTLMQQVSAAYQQFGECNDGYFAYVDTPIGRLPIISYTVLACQIRQNNHQSCRWFDYLMRMSLLRLGLTELDITESDYASVIAEMMLWQVRSRLYAFDTVRSGPNTTRGSDQWTRIGCFPDAELASGDCEDFSELLIETLHIFRHCDLPVNGSKLLLELQALLRQYTPFMAIGQLLVDTGYTSHAYVILLDTNFVEQRLDHIPSKRKQLLPAIVLEGTAYTESVWSATALNTPVDHRSAELSEQLLDLSTTDDERDSIDRMLKIKTPVATVHSEKKYGQVYVLLCGDYANPFRNETEAIQVLVSRERVYVGLPPLGVSHHDLVMYNGRTQLTAALRLNPANIEYLNTVMKDLPFSAFPQTPFPEQHLPRALNKTKGLTLTYDMRWVDYEVKRDTFKRLLKQFEQSHPTCQVYWTKIEVAKGLWMQSIQIEFP